MEEKCFSKKDASIGNIFLLDFLNIGIASTFLSIPVRVLLMAQCYTDVGRGASSFSPPAKRGRTLDDKSDDIDVCMP